MENTSPTPQLLPDSDYSLLFSMLCNRYKVKILEEIEMKIYLRGKEAEPSFAQATQ